MSIIIAAECAAGGDLRSTESLDRIARAFSKWARRATDIGRQTGSVLSNVDPEIGTAADAFAAAQHFNEMYPESAGNGALMRTAPVALAYLDDEKTMIEVARRVAALTHPHIDSLDACAIWCVAIGIAIREGRFDIRTAIDRAVDEDRRALWHARIDEAEAAGEVHRIANNGWVVAALQAAWICVVNSETLEETIEWGTRAGNDTDTVAAIAGALAGARWGVSAIPARWRRFLNGWPYVRAHKVIAHRDNTGPLQTIFDGDEGVGPMRVRDLIALAMSAVEGAAPTAGRGWPLAKDMGGRESKWVQLQFDLDVILGAEGDAQELEDCDAVVSLSRVGYNFVGGQEHIEFWLIDSTSGEANPNLDFVLRDAAKTIADLRAEGKKVFVHCVAAHNRTPSVGALYSALYCNVDVDEAIRVVDEQCKTSYGSNPFLRDAVRTIALSGRRN
jgi:ADP-ribosylglycohydrolase